MSKYFIQYNNNPHKRNTTDCVVRATAKVFYKTWSQMIVELAETSTQTGYMINDRANHRQYSIDHGYIKLPLYGLKLNVNQITRIQETYLTDNGESLRWLVAVKGHLTALVDGHIYDTWDCGRKHVEEIYIPVNYETIVKNEVIKLREGVSWE